MLKHCTVLEGHKSIFYFLKLHSPVGSKGGNQRLHEMRENKERKERVQQRMCKV